MKLRQIADKIIPRKVIATAGFVRVYLNLWNHTPKKNELLKDSIGKPIPWMTYASIEFLNSLNLTNCDVFEYGSGSSTLYWSHKAKTVTSVERSKNWYSTVKAILPQNCTLTHQGDEHHYAQEIAKYKRQFDIIVIDGAVRYPCLIESLPFLKKDGVILLDNLEWYPQTAQKLRDLGFTQIDFSSFAPQNAFPSCTSLFFKTTTLLNNRIETKNWKPVGGKFVVAYDDKPFDEIDPAVLVTDGRH